MKKSFLLFVPFLAFTASAGTNAFLSIQTNDLTVLPTNIWNSNALAIAGALQQINFSPGTNTNSTRFYPGQFTTNGSGQVQLQIINPAVLAGVVASSNLPASVATLSSNLDPGLTNAQGQTIAQQIGLAASALGSSLSNAIVTTNLTAAGAAVSNLVVTNLAVAGSINATSNINGAGGATLAGTVTAAEFAGSGAGLSNVPGGALAGVISGNGAGLTNIPVTALQGVGLTNSNNTTVNFSSNLFVAGAVSSGTAFLGSGASLSNISAGNVVAGPGTNVLSLSVLPVPVLTNTEPAAILPGLTVSNMTNTGQTQWSGDVAYTAFDNSSLSPSGEQADIATGTNVTVLLSGPTAAWAMDGLAGGRAGRWLRVEYDGGQSVTVRNESGIESTAANRIRTTTGTDVAFSASPLVLYFAYNPSLSRWILDSSSGPVANGNFTGTFAGTMSGNGSALTGLSNAWNASFQDNRPASNFDILQGTLPASTNYVIFNQTNAGTITQIAISRGGTPTNWNYNAYIGPTLRIIVDGVDRTKWIDETTGRTRTTNNGVPVISFFGADGWPIVWPGLGATNPPEYFKALRPGNIEISACDPASLTLTPLRNVYINFRSNCLIEITNNVATNNTYYSDVAWRVGAPVTGTSWNATAMINSNCGGGIFTGFGETNLPVKLEGLYWFYVESSAAGGYISPPIEMITDGRSWALGKGTEDCFGSSWNWENGMDRYDTPEWATIPFCSACGGPIYWGHPEWYLGGNGATGSGNTSWRFFSLIPNAGQEVYVTNSCAWSFDTSNGSGDGYSIGLTTYYTAWPN